MIEIPEMLNLIEIAVSERGENFRYADYADNPDLEGLPIDPGDCMYANPLTGRPLCIAGVVFYEAGLLGLVREGDIASNQPRLVGHVSREALEVLDAAQNAQDIEMTWGEALEFARQRAEAQS